MSMTKTEKDKAMADPMADNRSEFDHETGKLTEPEVGTDPQVLRHRVDAIKDPALFEEEQGNGPIPRRGDPFAHQRDEKAAKAGGEAELKESDARAKRGEETAEARYKREAKELEARTAIRGDERAKMSDK